MEKFTYKTRKGVEVEYFKYTEDEIGQANSISIVDWARQNGYDTKTERRWARIKDQGGLTVDTYTNRWYCHSSKVGGGPIQLVMHLHNLPWKEAVGELLNHEGIYEIAVPKPDLKMLSKDDFVLPEKNHTYKHLYAYLVKERKIHPDIINEFVKKKLLYENTKRSCVFVGVNNDGLPVSAVIRSTNTIGEPFKGDAPLSDKRFTFCRPGKNNVLTVFEAPIDLLSYMTIFKMHNLLHRIENDHLLTLCSLNENSLIQYLEDHPEIEEIQLGIDNDKWGNKAATRIFNEYSKNYKVKRIHIAENDFNDVLKNEVIKMRQKLYMAQIQQNSDSLNEEELEPV